jgi:8-oxo-dGTP pyrophosphatase MutT (NUDIX family)
MSDTHWKVLKAATEVWGNEWIKIQEICVQLPTGVTAEFYAMDAPDGVAVLAVDNQHRAILTRQFRPALGQVVLELPAGQVENNEAHREAALRELVEEVGLHVTDLHYLGSYYRNPAKDTGSTHVYLGRAAGRTAPHFECYEYVQMVRLSLDDLTMQVLNHEIQDPATVFAVLMLRSRLERGDIQL